MKARLSLVSQGKIERALLAEGLTPAGLDEVGRGCLAGPVHAGCVILDYQALRRLPRRDRLLIRDSKQLSREQRAAAVPLIHSISRAFGIGSASVDEIEADGIVPATFAAMRRAIAQCTAAIFDVLLVDGKFPLAGYHGRQMPLIRGDSRSFAIAAASILAKEERDAFMRQVGAEQFPSYGFDAHVGYGTAHHRAMIETHGICPLHRRNFAPIRAAVESNDATPLFG